MLDGSIFFNMAYAQDEPDWTEFTRLEVSGCRDDADESTEDETHIIPMIPAKRAEFFTVYGIRPDETSEAVTDCPDAVILLHVAATLGRRSGLPVLLHPSLGDLPCL